MSITALSISLPPSLYSGLKAKITYPSLPCSWGLACESVSSIYMQLCEIGKKGVRWFSHSSTYQNHWRAPPGNSVGVGQGPQIFIASKFACDTQTRVQLLLSRFVSVPGVFRVGRGHSGSSSFLTSESYLLWSQLGGPLTPSSVIQKIVSKLFLVCNLFLLEKSSYFSFS